MDHGEGIEELRRRRRAALGRWLGALGAGLLGSVALAWAGWGLASGAALIATLALGLDNRRRLMMIDMLLARAEIEEFAGREELLRGEEGERLAREREASIAGIEFHTPGGVYGGRVVHLHAVKDGRAYDYAGLAISLDEPGPGMLLVNGLAYALAAKAPGKEAPPAPRHDPEHPLEGSPAPACADAPDRSEDAGGA